MEISKEFTFDSAHKLAWHKGKCGEIHGHTYRLVVVVKGDLNQNGVVIDFSDLKNIVESKVISKLDHKFLNDVVANPTAENLVVWIWSTLKPSLSLSEIKLWETPTSYVTFRGD